VEGVTLTEDVRIPHKNTHVSVLLSGGIDSTACPYDTL